MNNLNPTQRVGIGVSLALFIIGLITLGYGYYQKPYIEQQKSLKLKQEAIEKNRIEQTRKKQSEIRYKLNPININGATYDLYKDDFGGYKTRVFIDSVSHVSFVFREYRLVCDSTLNANYISGYIPIERESYSTYEGNIVIYSKNPTLREYLPTKDEKNSSQ